MLLSTMLSAYTLLLPLAVVPFGGLVLYFVLSGILGFIFAVLESLGLWQDNPWPLPLQKEQGLPAWVKSVPWKEWLLFIFWRSPMYLPHFLHGLWMFLYHDIRRSSINFVTDEELGRMISDGVIFRILEHDSVHDVYVLDMTHMKHWHPRPGFFACPTITRLKCVKRSDSGIDLIPISITVEREEEEEGPLTLLPADGASWKAAKLFVEQSIQLTVIVGIHALQHFPLDSVNAITKTILPKNNRVRQLLDPHFEHMLCLDETVAFHNRSPLNPDIIWGPFGSDTPKSLFVHFFKKYTMTAPPNMDKSFPLGRQLMDYYQVTRDFASHVLEDVSLTDPFLVRWAEDTSHYLPGFPKSSQLTKEILIDYVSTIVWSCSAFHSADHEVSLRANVHDAPFRLRIPPPRSKNMVGSPGTELEFAL